MRPSHQDLTSSADYDVRKNRAFAEILRTAVSVTESISKIIARDVPAEAAAHKQQCSSQPAFHFMADEQQNTSTQLIQNFAIALNAGQEDDYDDDIIWIDPSVQKDITNDCAMESIALVPVAAENITMPFTPSPSTSVGAADSSTPASPLIAQYATHPMASYDSLPIYLNNQQQNNTSDLWKDPIVAQLIRNYAEWSIKYPRRRRGLQLLVDSVQRRAVEIGVYDVSIKRGALDYRVDKIRNMLRRNQQEEMTAQQQRKHEQNMTIVHNFTANQQQPCPLTFVEPRAVINGQQFRNEFETTQFEQNPCSSVLSIEGEPDLVLLEDEATMVGFSTSRTEGNIQLAEIESEADKDSTDDIEILDCVKQNTVPIIIDDDDLGVNYEHFADPNKNSNATTAEVTNDSQPKEVEVPSGDDDLGVNYKHFADPNNNTNATTGEVTNESQSKEVEVPLGSIDKERPTETTDITLQAFEQLRVEFRDELMESESGVCMAQKTLRVKDAMQLAKRSKPFSRRVAENIGWSKRFVRVQPISRDASGLIQLIGDEIINCNQNLLHTLEETYPLIFMETKEEYESVCLNDNTLLYDDEMNREPVSEFDYCFEQWISNIIGREDDRTCNMVEEGEEETQEHSEEEEDQIYRGPVIKCPRMPKIKVLVNRIKNKARAEPRPSTNSPNPKQIRIDLSPPSSCNFFPSARRRQTHHDDPSTVRAVCRQALPQHIANKLFFNGSLKCTICDVEFSKSYYPKHMLVEHGLFIGENKQTIEFLDQMTTDQFAKLLWRCETCQCADFVDINAYIEHLETGTHLARGPTTKKNLLKEWSARAKN